MTVSNAVTRSSERTGRKTRRETSAGLNCRILSYAVQGYRYAAGRSQRTEAELARQVRRCRTVCDEGRTQIAEGWGGLQHIDLHILARWVVICRVGGRETSQKWLSRPGVEQCARGRCVAERSRHVCSRVELNRTQQGTVNDISRIAPGDRRRRLGDRDRRITAGWRVVGVACEGPMSSAARYVGECCAEIQKTGQVFTVDTCGRTSSAMRRAIVDAAVPIDRDRGAGLGNAVVHRAARVVVVPCDIGEGP